MRKSNIAVYPGTFDPVTYGHIDIIRRAARIFDKVIIAVAHNDEKSPLFSVGERVSMLKDSIGGLKNVIIDDFDGLVVDYVKGKGASVMIRGLRMISDFEHEFQMALTNRKLSEKIETIFMMPNESYSYISSKLIKEAASLGADVKNFIPKKVQILLKKKLRK
ncbi:MAG: pantetheine-phosphate adenylyltransferase [Omnitrophica bacterium RIFCSPLOWO2_02_FULL_45_16]|nr:MAG: pantetheine-phosphate adenylyltransferase [Omnitrophica bacterium RIFCSPHIGHO2_02_FULL_46_20]OGX00803.1 MAG: pantetheine-phosphate adenylyltransferase [Omnitrophica bacterium RIFCSPLOWO2_02_FULL_45_16]